MLNLWLRHCGSLYLERILAAESLSTSSPVCYTCSQSGQVFVCQDCLHAEPLCARCLCEEHKRIPTHRFRAWTGSCFLPTSSIATGYIFYLGHNGESCNKGATRDFVLGDSNGLHNVRIHFCHHKGSGDDASQLLRARIFPCSDLIPASGFTFRALRQFHHLSAGSMLSSQGFWDMLTMKTNSSFPEQAPKRYREFMRVTRQWQHLMDLKRAGVGLELPVNRLTGDLTLRCPACPLLNSNYTVDDIGPNELHFYVLHLAYDGNFHLVRKDKEFDKWDICLSDGRKYFVDVQSFKEHLQLNDNQTGSQSNKVLMLPPSITFQSHCKLQ
ncbi:hypothetical protein BDV93DRAFT_459337 [Ceratobasidium sp. AG-I]|nr:hypothetical protein BDV93DRAFT_459337 [Ceratobasidium sp. AG-I]